jgi:hypothetical protein
MSYSPHHFKKKFYRHFFIQSNKYILNTYYCQAVVEVQQLL